MASSSMALAMARTPRRPRASYPRSAIAARRYILENAVATLQSDVSRLAALCERTVRLVEELQSSIVEMRQEMRTRFAQIDARLDRIEERLDSLEAGQRDLTSITHQIYAEHGQRLKDLEDRFKAA